MARTGDDGPLTPRQHQVMRLLCEGRTHREIGETLEIHRHTVSDYVRSAVRKMGCANTPEATAHYYLWRELHSMARWQGVDRVSAERMRRRAGMLVPVERPEDDA